MLDQTQGSDYTIWAVAFLLYVCDAAKLLGARELLLVEVGGGRLASTLRENPFTMAGRVLAFGPLLQPHQGTFVAPWGTAWTDGAGLRSTLESLQQLRESLPVARILAGWSFVLLFVFGPVLTLALGPNAAVAYTAIVLYPTVLVAMFALWWQRRDFRLTGARAARLSIEILICPAFLPNLVRKITAAQRIEADGAQILAATASPDVKEEVLARLESRTEELIEEVSPDLALQEHLRFYLATIRGAR